jgi:L-threonylcarbamoyladenylate synthase
MRSSRLRLDDMRRVFVNPARPHRDAVQEAAKLIRAGGVVAIPTDTLYALAADPFSADAVRRVFDAKGRPESRPVPLIAADLAQVTAHLGALPADAARLAASFWPGPLTMLIAAPRALARQVSAGTGRVGVRVPDDAVARAVCQAAGHPLTATSANLSDEPPTADPAAVEDTLGDRIELLLDGGTTRGGPPSTIVDTTVIPAALVRAGAVSWDEIQACLASA